MVSSFNYSKILPYRYFYRDARGSGVTFKIGQRVQLLSKMGVECARHAGGSLRFYVASSYRTRLFNRGDESVGVCIDDGAVKLKR